MASVVRARSTRSLVTLLVLALVAAVLAVVPAVTALNSARAASAAADPTSLYTEDFENNVGIDPVLLTDYTGATGETYTADEAWLENCNGAILEYNTPDSALTGPVIDSCGSSVARNLFFSNLRQLAYALGSGGGSATNHAVAAFTAGDPGTNKIEFATNAPIRLADANGRFVTFSVDAAAVNCGSSAPEYQFSIVSGATATKVGDVINACDSSQTVTAPAIGAAGTTVVNVGTYTSDGSTLATGNTIGLQMVNTNGSGTGNDAAFDNIKILDVTPQLEKSFSPASIKQGQTSKLTFTITNTSELAAKNGWSFTDALPDGVVLADSVAASTTCPSGVVTGSAGGSSVKVSGNLSAGMDSCTATVNVTSDTVGTHTNGAANITETGLNKPADATLTVTSNAWTCSSYGYLFQTPDPKANTTHIVDPVDLVSGTVDPKNVFYTANNVNAVGYNVLDNFVYGWNEQSKEVVRVGADGTQTPLGAPTGLDSTVNYDVGDVDEYGHYYLTRNTEGSTTWYEVDVAPGSSTYGQLIGSGSLAYPKVSGAPADWAYIDGYFYGVSGANSPHHLIRYDLSTSTVTDLGVLSGMSNEAGGYGAVYADAAGYLYASNNSTGDIHRIDPKTLDAILVTDHGPASANNDGARCANAPIPTITVVKQVDGRVLPDDQFTVGLQQTDGTVLTSATTKVADTKVSTADWPVEAKTAYTVTDEMADGSPDALTAYDPTVSCVDSTTGDTVDTSGDVGAWQVTSSDADPIVCTVTNTPGTPKFTMKKTASASTAKPGDTVSYTVTLTNMSTVPFTAASPATFTDDLSGVLDDASYNKDASAGATVSDDTLNWSGSLAVGETKTITYSVTVDAPDNGDHELKNVAVPGNGGDCTTDADCQTDTLVQSFHTTKTADSTDVTPGKTVTYTITVVNTGKVAYTDDAPASFTDDLSKVIDDATYNDDVTGGASYTAPTLSWSGALDVGQTVTITYSVTVNSPDTGDGKLDNSVVTTPDGGCTVGSTDPDCNSDVVTRAFTYTKTASRATAEPGDTITYTVTVTNTGAEAFTADDPASFTDDMSGVLDDATYDNDATKGAALSGNTLSWAGALPVGAVEKVTYSVKVNDPDSGDHELKNAVTTTDNHGGCVGTCDTDTKIRDFSVVKTASAATAKPGDIVVYTLTVTGTGAEPYTSGSPAKLHDDLSGVLDDASYNKDATEGATVHGTTLKWSGALGLGQKLTITYSVTVDAPDKGDKVLKNVVVADNGTHPKDPSKQGTKTPVASFEVVKRASTAHTETGAVVRYTITVKNTGKVDYTKADPASFTDDLSKVLDDATYNADATGGASYSAPTLSWSAPLAVGKSAVIAYSVTVSAPDNGDGSLKNAVVTPIDGNCASGSTASECAVTTTVDPAGVAALPHTGTNALPAALIALLLGGAGGLALLIAALLRRRRFDQ